MKQYFSQHWLIAQFPKPSQGYIHHARFYVDAWCEETGDSKDSLPELIHNRCFRFDRIQGILPISIVSGDSTGGEWRDLGLDSLLVQLHFYRGLAKAYEFRQGVDEREEFDGDIRRVWRRTSNPFWLLKDIRGYGSDCEIIAPESIREQAKADARSTLDNYQTKHLPK